MEVVENGASQLEIDIAITDLTPLDSADDSAPTLATKIFVEACCPVGNPCESSMFNYDDPGVDTASIVLPKPSCGEGVEEVKVTVDADLDKKAGRDALVNLLPDDVTFIATRDDGIDADASYLDIKFQGHESSSMNGVKISAWCVDPNSAIRTGTWQNGVVKSYLSDLSGTNINNPGNMPKVAWIMNNFIPGKPYTYDFGSGDETYVMTSSTIQSAIWRLIDSTFSYSNWNGVALSPEWANHIMTEAEAHGNFVPGCDDLFPLILIPANNAQVLILATTFGDLQIPCQEETATVEATVVCVPDDRTFPGGYGDPHFLTWGNQYFDFMGECDLVLAESKKFGNGLGMTAHVRLKSRFDYSYIESAAVKIGDDVLEVGAYGSYMVNGISNADLNAFKMGHRFTVTKDTKNDHDHTFDIQVNNIDHILVKAFKDLVSVRFTGAEEKEFKDVVGVMGDYYHGKRLDRDGQNIIVDYNEFAQEWQVIPGVDPELFQTGPSVVFPAQHCILPTPVKQGSRRLGESISVEAATQACNHFGSKEAVDACIYDVIATGDLEAAQAGAF